MPTEVEITYTEAHNARIKQTARGNEAIDMLAKHLESLYGTLSVSIHESKYSSGTHGQPDLVIGKYGIEVKRVEFFCKHNYKRGDNYHVHLNNLSIDPQSWRRLKAWCEEHHKQPLLIAVVTHGRQKPLFYVFSEAQIDELAQQKSSKWIQINSWRVLQEGNPLNNGILEV